MTINYIKHIKAFYNRQVKEQNLTPTAISVYHALFQVWNRSKFKCPISISRDEVMMLSMVGSASTFSKAMHKLHDLEYLRYEPSFSPLEGSQVYMVDLHMADHFDKKQIGDNRARDEAGTKNRTSTEQLNEPYINNTKLINTNLEKGPLTPDNDLLLNGVDDASTIPPAEKSVEKFFGLGGLPASEAKKFYLHFASNGWKIGGKARMIDWHAAAEKWIIGVLENKQGGQNYSSSDNAPKKYDEPL